MASTEDLDDNTVDSGIKPRISAVVHCPSCGLHVTGGFSSCPNDGTRLLPDPTADAVLQDRYDSLELIGEGGMSAIYKARHKLMKRMVAIKLLHSRFRNNVDTMRRFQKEAEAISSLSHENVVNVFDFGQLQHGQAYMVMNYVSGQSMADLIKRDNPLELQRALQLLLQISAGLDHAHRKHIVHRDLKPTNVMITTEESGKEKAIIVDFGIAKFLADEEGATQGQPLTKTGDVIGSPYYMSPEQCLGRQIDVRSDIYSFGCLIFESLVGKPVFMGNNSLETMHKHIRERPPALDQMNGNPALKPHMQAIIHKALEKEPDRRYQTIAELDHDLKIMDAAIKKGNVPKLSSLNAFSDIRLKRISVAAVAIGAVLCVGQMIFWLNAPSQHNREPGSVYIDHTADAAGNDKLKEAIKNDPLLTKLDASRISNTGLAELSNLHELQVLKLKDSTADDAALTALSKLPHLSDLTLIDNKIGDTGMPTIGKLKNLRNLSIESDKITDASFGNLASLKNLTALSFHNVKITADGIETLSKLPQLKTLALQANATNEIGDDVLEAITKKLPNLETLKIDESQITDEALAKLSRMPHLSRLSLAFAKKVSNKGMEPLSHLKLKWLNICGVNISDDGLKCLSKMPGLEELFLWRLTISDNSMDDINKMPSLKVLHLSSTPVTDEGFSKLTALKNLEDLKLKGTKVSDAGLSTLKNFPQLKRLSLADLPITDEGLKTVIANCPNLTELDISGTAISSAGLPQLSALKSLKHLYLKDCEHVDEKAIESLHHTFPPCRTHTHKPMASRALD